MAPGVEPYELRLGRDTRWALSEASHYFDESGLLRQSLEKITSRLNELSIPYAVAGGLAVFIHGLHRFTDDVDILVTPQGLQSIHHHLDGLGYVPLFTGSKNLRDTETGVRIEFIIAGQFPGDGKPKPVAFPNPAEVAYEKDGIKFVNLPTLLTLKLASGMTNPGRLKDLADVQELIKALNLGLDFATQLPEYVRQKFSELWQAAR